MKKYTVLAVLLAVAPMLIVPALAQPVAELGPPKAGKTFRDCEGCPEMVEIIAGAFEMGSENGDADERPVHAVKLARNYAIGKYEVTQGQWRAIMGVNPSNFGACGDDCPVERVNWQDMQEFISKLNARTGKRYRLPSEAEWEAACRAGGKHEYCGGDRADNVAWYGSNSKKSPHPVGKKQPNAFGLYDMSGNVWEWVEDCRHKNYAGAPADGSAWVSANCGRRVLRGGSWYSAVQEARASARDSSSPLSRDSSDGFRLARDMD